MTERNEPFPQRPTLIWDGDCSFCRRWVTRWRNLTGDAIDYEPSQRVAEKLRQIPREEFGKAVFFAEPDGRVTRAAEAVFRSLATAGQKRYLLWLYEHVPPFRWLTEFVYGVIARNRNLIDWFDTRIVGTETRPITYRLTRGLFLRLLGLVYLIAFVSLWVQVDGLIGSKGILPVRIFLENVQQSIGREGYRLAPTLLWWKSSDAFLHGICVAGMVAAGMLIVGVLPKFCCVALWACYLSLTVAGQDFLSFQWDALLLESGFLAILFAPWLWLGSTIRSSGIVLFLIRWLLFRLMLLSALVKWFSGDESWRAMQAMRYHFETQPLPTWTSWYAHHAPNWLLAFCCAAMFFVEFIVPFLYFFPRRTRLLAFWLTVIFQLGIMATGNYGFFNIMAIVLSISLLDDVAVAKVTRGKLLFPLRRPIIRPWILAPIGVCLFLLTLVAGIQRLRWNVSWPRPIIAMRQYTAPFSIANGYGLFEVMTTERPELIIEGSQDGVNWLEYEFKYKMGDVTRRPRFCIPHMPRLDWQMWFEALETRGVHMWFQNLLVALLENRPEVLKLIGKNPFPDKPPKYVRVIVYEYRFSDSATRQATGEWWVRRPLRLRIAPAALPARDPEFDLRL
jgi:predicted DCC family thiol-disulfide oxidoreductase YuxK